MASPAPEDGRCYREIRSDRFPQGVPRVEFGTVVAQKRVLDGRNALDREAWTTAGWTYRALGRRAG